MICGQRRRKTEIILCPKSKLTSTIYGQVKGFCSRNLFPSAQVGHCQRKFFFFLCRGARAFANIHFFLLSIRTLLPMVIKTFKQRWTRMVSLMKTFSDWKRRRKQCRKITYVNRLEYIYIVYVMCRRNEDRKCVCLFSEMSQGR